MSLCQQADNLNCSSAVYHTLSEKKKKVKVITYEDISPVDELEIIQGGIAQAQTAQVTIICDEKLQTVSTPPTAKLLILPCCAV